MCRKYLYNINNFTSTINIHNKIMNPEYYINFPKCNKYIDLIN
jgi:hypothetical protein